MVDTRVEADSPSVKANGQEECMLQRAADYFRQEWNELKVALHLAPAESLVADQTVAPPIVVGDSRRVAEVLDSTGAHTNSSNFRVETLTGDASKPIAVKDSLNGDVRRFIYNSNRDLQEVVLPNGSYVAEANSKWSFVDNFGVKSQTQMEWLQVDPAGNVSFDNTSIGARVTLTPDEHTIISYWHRNDWAYRGNWTKEVKNPDESLKAVTDYSGAVLRDFKYNDQHQLVAIHNNDGTSWRTEDGGKVWIFSEADNKQTTYADLDMKVDPKGNIGYTVGGRKVVEFVNGQNMISPPADWQRRVIEHASGLAAVA